MISSFTIHAYTIASKARRAPRSVCEYAGGSSSDPDALHGFVRHRLGNDSGTEGFKFIVDQAQSSSKPRRPVLLRRLKLI